MARRRTPAKSLSGSEAPALLRLVYLVVPKHLVNRILPPDASVARQVLPTASRRFYLCLTSTAACHASPSTCRRTYSEVSKVCCYPGGYLVCSVFCRWCRDGGLHGQNRVLRGCNAQGGWYERRHAYARAHACARVHDRAHTQGSLRQTVTRERVPCHARVTTERQALAQWEREEAARLKQDREQRRLQREKIDREHYRVRLQEELRVLRMHERDTGTNMDADKVC